MKDAFVTAAVPGYQRTEEGKQAEALLREFTRTVLLPGSDSENAGNGGDQSVVSHQKVYDERSVASSLLAKGPDGTGG
jgi:hypothetical protein